MISKHFFQNISEFSSLILKTFWEYPGILLFYLQRHFEENSVILFCISKDIFSEKILEYLSWFTKTFLGTFQSSFLNLWIYFFYLFFLLHFGIFLVFFNSWIHVFISKDIFGNILEHSSIFLVIFLGKFQNTTLNLERRFVCKILGSFSVSKDILGNNLEYSLSLLILHTDKISFALIICLLFFDILR